MTIIVTTHDNRTVKLRPHSVEREDVLQRYIHNHPESLPLEEIHEDIRLCVLCREFPTSSGPIDALGVDQAGEVYVIETKLFKNPDKRTVIAQALDYGSALWHDYESPAAFPERIDAVLRQRGLPGLRDQLLEFTGSAEAVELIVDRMGANQRSGRLRFVILMNQLGDQLKQLITYLNQNSKFTVYAVELDFYRHDGLEIVLPRLYGSEAKKDFGESSSSGRRKWDEESYFAHANQQLQAVEVSTLRRVYESARTWAADINWGTGVTAGSFSPKRPPEWPKAPFAVYSNGQLVLNFPYFNYGTSAARVEEFVGVLRNAGFSLPADYMQRYVSFAPADWMDKVASLERAIQTVLR